MKRITQLLWRSGGRASQGDRGPRQGAVSERRAGQGAYRPFATHGLLASETGGLGQARAEPALMLTPPDHATEDDDGLLMASEVAQLRLDADWVIMSACNTAAGEAGNAESLSGLARALFYAGSRALLVSHWYVDSDAAVAITTKAIGALQADRPIRGVAPLEA